ncbi:hypothetical protein EDM53_04835 [Rickettsiales endosymbiont of Peranema trichophorum]|uniref:hypothetical protein n=1 Tax=Rickettsiales endosymbiont of Peranema trichophorum TaxID=2486577 RepID=UPI001022AE19|nr:hypothetical protein [Rickettsiales endosymbiont of Peranema trichophorum]RZI45630.1 hypothetical protein EDM53_04835 [Rickettsiales endosymbiont of Peranema trichophorum]
MAQTQENELRMEVARLLQTAQSLQQEVQLLQKRYAGMERKITVQSVTINELIKTLDKGGCSSGLYWKYIGYTAVSLVGLVVFPGFFYKVWKYYYKPSVGTKGPEVQGEGDNGNNNNDGNDNKDDRGDSGWGENEKKEEEKEAAESSLQKQALRASSVTSLLHGAASMPMLHHTSSVVSTEQQEGELHRTHTTLSGVPRGRYVSPRKRSAVELKKAELLKQQEDTSSGTPTSRTTSCTTMVLYGEDKLCLDSMNSQPSQLPHDSLNSEPSTSGNDGNAAIVSPQGLGDGGSEVIEYSDSISSHPSQTSQAFQNLDLNLDIPDNGETNDVIPPVAPASSLLRQRQVVQEQIDWNSAANSGAPVAPLPAPQSDGPEPDLIQFSSDSDSADTEGLNDPNTQEPEVQAPGPQVPEGFAD